MNIFLKALGLAAVLFIYGYAVTHLGLDHAGHVQTGMEGAGRANHEHAGHVHQDHH